MARIFAYIVHKGGVADDSAVELLAAATKIDSAQPPMAIVTGWGAGLDAVCESLRDSYGEIWKVANESLAYPNAELVRKALVQVLPQGSILLVPHSHFGVDLSPGLSIKLNAAYVSDVLEIEAVQGSTLKLVRQEFGGQVSTHVLCDISDGAVLNIRPGTVGYALACPPIKASIIDKSSQVASLSSNRRYLETLVAETVITLDSSNAWGSSGSVLRTQIFLSSLSADGKERGVRF